MTTLAYPNPRWAGAALYIGGRRYKLQEPRIDLRRLREPLPLQRLTATAVGAADPIGAACTRSPNPSRASKSRNWAAASALSAVTSPQGAAPSHARSSVKKRKKKPRRREGGRQVEAYGVSFS